MSLYHSKTFVFLLTLSLLVPSSLPAGNPRPQNQPSPEQVVDVALDGQQTLQGQIVNANGQTLDGAQISIRRGQDLVATTTSDAQGTFQVTGIPSGVYRISCPGNSVTCRVWDAAIAPPSAKSSVVMVSGPNPVRGQFGMLDPVSTTSIALGITAVTLSAITLSKVDDLDHKIDRTASP